MIIVGITGSVGTGKSIVAKFFKELGAYIIDWDVIAREVVRPHLKAWEGIIKYFGKDVLNEDSTLNRQKLAEIVFNDSEKLRRLNQIVHPLRSTRNLQDREMKQEVVDYSSTSSSVLSLEKRLRKKSVTLRRYTPNTNKAPIRLASSSCTK